MFQIIIPLNEYTIINRRIYRLIIVTDRQCILLLISDSSESKEAFASQ
jgi:hypothetical protein